MQEKDKDQEITSEVIIKKKTKEKKEKAEAKEKVKLLPYGGINGNKIISQYVASNPQLVLIAASEELAELIQAVSKKLRGVRKNDAVVEELADALLAIEYIRQACGIPYEEVQMLTNFKIERLEYRFKDKTFFARGVSDKYKYLKKAILTEVKSKSNVALDAQSDESTTDESVLTNED